MEQNFQIVLHVSAAAELFQKNFLAYLHIYIQQNDTTSD